jgi:hypothetical protein
MNSETREKLVDAAKHAGAIVGCGTCGNYSVYASDDDANRRAYAIATNLWSDNEFRADSREDILDMMKGVLDDTNHRCPSCG